MVNFYYICNVFKLWSVINGVWDYNNWRLYINIVRSVIYLLILIIICIFKI